MTSNIPIGLVVLLTLQVVLKLKDEQNQYRQLPLRKKLTSMDPLGCVIFIGAVCSLLLALQWGGQTLPWQSAKIIGLLVGFALMTILFVFMQLRLQSNALIPVHVFRHRSIWTGAMVLFFLGSSNYLVSILLLSICLMTILD